MGEPMKAQEVFASALCERSLAAMARARIALHCGDIPAARQALANAQRPRHLLNFAIPLLSVQTGRSMRSSGAPSWAPWPGRPG